MSCVQEAQTNKSCLTVCRPTLLLENYQPWLDLKVHSNVDASVAEVPQCLRFYPKINHYTDNIPIPLKTTLLFFYVFFLTFSTELHFNFGHLCPYFPFNLENTSLIVMLILSVQFLFLTSSSSAGVRVSPGELCVPLVQVRRGKSFMVLNFKKKHVEVVLNSLLWFSGTSQTTIRVWMNWGWPFASSLQWLSAGLRRSVIFLIIIINKEETHLNSFHHWLSADCV